MPEYLLDMLHDGLIRWLWALEALCTDDVLEFHDPVSRYVEFDLWQLIVWLAALVIVDAVKVSGVAPLREDLGEDFIQPDYSCDESHLQPVVEYLILGVVGIECIANYLLKIGCELSKVDSL